MEFITNKGKEILSIVKKYGLEKFYNPFSGVLEIDNDIFTSELRLVVINYLNDLCMWALKNKENVENYIMTISMYDNKKMWIVGQRIE